MSENKPEYQKNNPPQWKPLPGHVLAYGDTGFEIKLTPENKLAVFELIDPDGRKSAGDNLANLKRFAEQQHKERLEFEIP